MIETAIAALLFAGAFLLGSRVHPLLRRLIGDRHTVVSFGSGMAIAYVFVQVMPKLATARRGFAESASGHLQYEGMSINFFALLGFLAFYGIDHLRMQAHESAVGWRERLASRLHIGGFAAYAWLVSYLLLHNIEKTAASTVRYAVAITFHLLSMDDALHHEHGASYARSGRFVLGRVNTNGANV
jgi:hypothetical protein